jgi:hypothetical protein
VPVASAWLPQAQSGVWILNLSSSTSPDTPTVK